MQCYRLQFLKTTMILRTMPICLRSEYNSILSRRTNDTIFPINGMSFINVLFPLPLVQQPQQVPAGMVRLMSLSIWGDPG